MADQGKWFKLWCSSLHDEALENLSLEDWARWARLGAYIKEHGKDGKIRFSPPYRALLNLFRVPTFETANGVLQLFPNCTLGERNLTVSPETSTSVSLEVEFTNWHKFQGDFSSARVRKFRDKKRHSETIQEEKRSRRDKKRREVFTPPTPLEAEDYAKEIGFVLDGEKFVAHYQKTGWRMKSGPITDWKSCVVTWKKNQREPNGSEKPDWQ